ncbi:hypothetical protein ABIA32_004494 [Streptacidiphilus sp. MAP12-20]|uniref:hypothetical protein n=1 Tax=Streptacidiphilus sp. MAP12-20 TaxID=3156299 RepID=UPI0035156446
MWRWLAPVWICVVLVVSIRNVGPSWSAHLGEGVKGTWTQTGYPCAGRHSCVCKGEFVSADGAERLSDVPVHRYGGGCLVGGGSVPALAEGRIVYPADGGPAWFASSAGVALCAALLLLWGWTDGRRLVRWVRWVRLTVRR